MSNELPHLLNLLNPADYSQNWVTRSGTLILPSTASAQLIPPEPRRFSLLIGTVATQNYKLGLKNFDTNNEYILFQTASGGQSFFLTWPMHGGLVQSQWWAASGSGIAMRLSWIETLWIPIGVS